MTRIQRSKTINATPAAVWAVLGRYMHADEISPAIIRVDALTDGADGVGSKRRNHFENGTSLVETVKAWTPGQGFTVRLSEMDAMPLHEATADIRIIPAGAQACVIWSFDYRVKFGPLGWLLGQTLTKMMMGKVLNQNLNALATKAAA